MEIPKGNKFTVLSVVRLEDENVRQMEIPHHI
jgi:hypothetical protein